ncbi:sensor histidine kinase [Nannocystis punicea]|uniref:histidine kinase n=1 Tax=Nannocystis punicea TaxID=2995304 RepID=A0ABY7HDV7_9BACT|nr:HAMP domain-containing sensor histidine kinase [Nannocystis poenicansa]WAS97461.1 HAMP domain-containing sensor histidine kinase [Nannocystis poenicansa]
MSERSASESQWEGSTEDLGQLAREVDELAPGFPRAGQPTRLRAERDVLAGVAAAYTLAVGLDVAWALIVWDSRGAAAPWPLFALLVPHLFILTAALLTVYAALPAARWLRPEELGRPAPVGGAWLVRALGFLAVPLHPLLDARERNELLRVAPRSEVEQAAGALQRVPRVVARAVFSGLLVIALSDALIARNPLQWTWPTTLAHACLWTAIAAPLAALAANWARRSLRGDLLACPIAQLPLADRPASMTGRLGWAGLLLLAGVAAPLLGAHLWLHAHARADAIVAAQRTAESLIDVAGPADEEDLGRRLAQAPGATVLTARGAVYGPDLSIKPGDDGLLDADGDGDFDRFAVQRGGARAVVPMRRATVDNAVPFVLAGGLALLAGLLAIGLHARRSERDLARVRAQVAEEPAPAPQGAEWQALSQSIEALVARMHEATIARFVALEKAEETDRLRSQFLANMSHDLRSPLNSILGFSSLLLRGVDGTLDAETREMVETIAAAGRDLLQQIDAILDMARIEARRIEKQAEPVPLAPLISKAVQRARNRGGDHLNYTVEAVPGLPTAYIDPRHLVQALENLLLFAGKRLTAGSLNIKLRRGDPDAPLGLQLHVTTPLKPASEQQMGLARKGFHRLPGHRGLGLELPIADALLKIEGCRLDVREVGQAMVFKIHLPAAEARSRVPLIERAHPAADSTAPPA